ncbi:hypothetical protein CFOL_v3_06750 [Cephalotus follicularis]|uniref:Uncharacterized protein n=1 Tax=Cephalotus follicularis TaxID=3775 RepID=A0A1Q3B5I0_CEPFO|nr:hypothetical protein CFOL_v3_06750 [Cephalotus follicularis]
MAKKKGTHQSKGQKQQESPPQNQGKIPEPTMNDTAEKLHNLKSLNSLLITETIERRQQVESLEQAKEDLENELTRSKMETLALKTELTRASEDSLGLEVEKDFLSVYMGTQMREMSIGIDREKVEREVGIGVLKEEVNCLMSKLESERGRLRQAFQERDLIRGFLDLKFGEVNGLKEELSEMKNKERNLENEIFRLKQECEGLVEEKEKSERAIEAVRREKDLVERNLNEGGRVIADLKIEIEGILSEKKELESETIEQRVKIEELKKKLGILNEILLKLRKEEVELTMKVLELDKCCGEAMEREQKMVMEIDALKGEKREKQEIIDRLEEKSNSLEKTLKKMILDVREREKQVEVLVRAKEEIEGLKSRQEIEIVDLHKEVGELRDAVFALQDKCKDKEEKNKGLLSEIWHFKDAFEQVTLERDGARKGFDEEKKNGMDLMSKVSEMEKRVVDSVEDLVRMKNEHEKVIREKKELENRVKLLLEENDGVQIDFLEAKHCIGDLRAKMKLSSINSVQALTMLKNTAALVCQSEEGSDAKEAAAVANERKLESQSEEGSDEKEASTSNERKLENEIEPYAAELEAIKSAFRNKEATLEDMTRQLESMKKTVSKEKNKRSFWSAVTSAAVLAAASIAYVARARE